jgi:type I restriction enzyme S subunit
MTEQTARKVPQIRFKGFEYAWEEALIGEVLTEKKRPIVLRDQQRYELITVKRRNEGIVSRGHLFGRDILVKNYAQLQTGDFVISKRQVVHGATGMVPPELDGAIVSNEYLVAVNSSKLLTEFLTILASLPDMRHKFFLSSYGVDIEKLFFDAEDWKKRNVTIPDITEQTQIGEFFRELDSLIGLHQRKHDKLVTLKKAMLQKMFPQPGATTPEIRFKGFSGEWEEKALGELTPLRGGYAFQSSKFRNSGIAIIKISNILADGTIGGGFAFYAEQANDANYSLPDNAALLAMSGATTGKVSILKKINSEKFYQNQRVGYFEDLGISDYSFISTLVRSHYFADQLDSVLVAGAQPNVSSKEVNNFNFQIPKSKAEQQKIGTYFRTLDELISKHAIQLQKLQQIKSACLEKMFV